MPFTVHPVFLPPAEGQSLWRYLDFPRFYFLVTRRRMFLSNLASLTNDPWESLPTRGVFDPDRRISVSTIDTLDPGGVLDLGKAKDPQIMTLKDFYGPAKFDFEVQKQVSGFRELRKTLFVSCWHMNETESEALWRIYGTRDYGLCIRSTYGRLSESVTHPQPIYAGTVSYLDEARENVRTDNIFHNCLWKRKSFEHEREFRVVVQARDQMSRRGLELPTDVNRLIEGVIVHPGADDWFREIVSDLVRSCQLEAKVYRSTLLEEPNYRFDKKTGVTLGDPPSRLGGPRRAWHRGMEGQWLPHQLQRHP